MKRIMETILVTFAGGMLFTLLHVPLSWMLGPLAAALLWTTLARRRLAWPGGLRDAGLALLGYGMGLSFTIESARQISSQLPTMLAATLLTVAASLGIALLTARFTGIGKASGVIGSIPGGLSQMVVLSEEVDGADRSVVAFMQTIRLLTVIFAVPFLAVHGLADGDTTGAAGAAAAAGGTSASLLGSLADWAADIAARPLVAAAMAAIVLASAWVAVRLRFPTPYFLGPILAAGIAAVAGYEPPHLPPLFTLLAQWSLGIYMGLGIKLGSLSNWRKLLPVSIAGSIAIVGFSLGISYAFSKLNLMSLATAFLGTSPGGMAEMAVTASIVHADVSMVVAYQMFRILFILFIVPYMLRWGFRRFGARASSS